MVLIFWGVIAVSIVALALALMWSLGSPIKAALGLVLLVSGFSIASSLGINPLSVPFVLLVGYLATPLVRGFIEGHSGKDAGVDRHQSGGPA